MTQVEPPRSYGAPPVPIVDAGAVSRVAIIGDVHGNAVALAAVLEELRRDPPDLVVVNGDLSWGAEPEATLALADELDGALFVRGNAESALLAAATSGTGTWMLERHPPARLAQIEGFAGAVNVEVDGLGRVFVCHGSPRGDQELVTQETPDERMRALLEGVEADVLVTAHVHLQFARSVLGITSANAGSVGLPYGDTPAAYWAELGPEIRLRRTPYDVAKAVRHTHASSIPSAHSIAALLQQPPSVEEIVEHAERLEASD
ncbi:MAG TPA: metallophosphoesterase family protein [Gaiellaceae bacterium]|nr:metallophosphoesterase family protein [Gaiellaceae bacterium]